MVAQHGLFLQKASKFEEAVASIVDPARPAVDHDQYLIVVLLQLVAIGMNEVVTLVGNGMGHGAMKIVRGMVENAINAEYIRIFPGQGEKYSEWHWVELHKQLGRLRETSPEKLAEISPEELAAFDVEYQRLKSLFRYKVLSDEGTERTIKQDSWCRDNLFQRAEKAGSALLYTTVLPQANQILHGTIGGWLNEMDETDLRVEYPPTDRWGSEALIAGHLALIQVIESAARALDVSPNPSVVTLAEDFQEVWKQDPGPSAASVPA